MGDVGLVLLTPSVEVGGFIGALALMRMGLAKEDGFWV